MSTTRVLEELTAAAAATSQSDKRQFDESTKTHASYRRLLEPATHGNSAAVVTVFRNEFRHILDLYSLYSDAVDKASNVVRDFPMLFPQACKTAGIAIDPESRHPQYTVRRGFIRVSIDADKLEAEISTRDGRHVTIPSDINPLVAYLRDQIKRLFEIQRDQDRLLRGLKTSYMAILKDDNKPVGHDLPIRRVANRLSKNWGHFRYDEFNVDLGNLIRSGQTTADSMRLHLFHTRDTKRGMLLYGLESGGYVDLISFRSDE